MWSNGAGCPASYCTASGVCSTRQLRDQLSMLAEILVTEHHSTLSLDRQKGVFRPTVEIIEEFRREVAGYLGASCPMSHCNATTSSRSNSWLCHLKLEVIFFFLTVASLIPQLLFCLLHTQTCYGEQVLLLSLALFWFPLRFLCFSSARRQLHYC